MDLLPLNFPVFYQCVVKGNTNLLQYDAVSVLLLGKLRKDCETIYIRDAEATGYISGKKSIKKEIMNQATRISKEDARKRIDELGFQNLTGIANATRELLAIVDIPPDMRQKIGKAQDDLSVITETFIMALKCPPKNIFPLEMEEKTRIALCYSKENTDAFMNSIKDKNPILPDDLDKQTPNSSKSRKLTTEEIEALLAGMDEVKPKRTVDTKKSQVPAFSEDMSFVPCFYYCQDNSKEINLFFELTNVSLSMGITAFSDLFGIALTPHVPSLEIYEKLSFFLDQFQNDNNTLIFYKFTVGSLDNYRVPDKMGISGIIMIDLDSDFIRDFYDEQVKMSSLKFISFAQELEFQISLNNELGSIFSGNAATAIANFIDRPVTIRKIKELELEDILWVNKSAIIGIQPFSIHNGKSFHARLLVPLDAPDKLWKLYRE